MTLDAGHRLGTYEILSPIGAGGMGEVYRARDTRLGREVAIKVLPADRVADESRRRRFVQEARAASALNHSSIVTIHEIESQDGVDFIVMEYVPGKTLGTLLRSRLKLSESIGIAVPIADALARAHAAGIVHRDLKPANVMVTPEGAVKVLDFGLAKLVAPDETSEEHETMTEETREPVGSGPGTVAGTPGYMSPEQASGALVDARSDIFAFGCLLYEMVTGRRAFPGGSRAETLASLLRDQPKAPSEIVAEVPRDLDKLILRCLRKEPAKRFQHIADVKVELEEIRQEPGAPPVAGGLAPPSRRKRALLWTTALAGVLAVAAGLRLGRRSPDAPIPSPRVVPLSATSGHERWPTFSPDGSQVAFSWDGEVAEEAKANWDTWLMMIGSSETRRLTTDPAVDVYPSWSPDGRQIAFLRLRLPDPGAAIFVVSPLGGVERRVADFPAGYSQLGWSPDGRWLAARRARSPGETAPESGGLHLIPLQEGQARAITAPRAPAFDTHPAFSPDGRSLAYASCAFYTYPPCDVHVVDVGPAFLPRSAPRRLTRQPAGINGLAWSRDGRSVLYAVAHVGVDWSRLWRVDASGEHPPERVELAPQGATSPAVSRLQDRLAFTLDRQDVDLYRFDVGGPIKPFFASTFSDYNPSYSPDGKRIAFESGRSGQRQEIWLADADGSNPIQLTQGPGVWQGTPRFSPDGRRIAFSARGEDGFADLWVIDAAGGSLRRLTHAPFHESFPTWSPDGRWIYYRDDRADGRDLSRIPAEGGSPERVTRHGGFVGRFSADGKTLYYTRRDGLSPLFGLTLPDGPERQVAECVLSRSLADGPDGIYYVGCSGRGPFILTPSGNLLEREAPLYRFDPVRGLSQRLATLPIGSGANGIAVFPQGKTVLFSTMSTSGDVMMIENFR